MLASTFMVVGLLFQAVTPEAVEHAKAGLAARQQGRLAEAVAEFRRVTELAPDLAAGYVNLGAALIENHQYGEAIAPLKKALSLNPALEGADQMLGMALLSAGYTQEALAHLEKAHDPAVLGIAQVKLGRFTEAIANLNTALEKRPNDPNLLYYLGRASGLLSKRAFDVLEANQPDSPRAHQALAENYVALRQLTEAEAQYKAATKVRSDIPGIHLAMGQMYLLIPNLEQAEVEFRKEIELQPGDAESSFNLGNTLLQQGKIKDARAQLQKADSLRPDMPETLYALGKADSLSSDAAGAEKAWRRVIELDGKSTLAAQAHFGLAAIYRKQGKQKEAAREMSDYESLMHHGPPAEK